MIYSYNEVVEWVNKKAYIKINDIYHRVMVSSINIDFKKKEIEFTVSHDGQEIKVDKLYDRIWWTSPERIKQDIPEFNERLVKIINVIGEQTIPNYIPELIFLRYKKRPYVYLRHISWWWLYRYTILPYYAIAEFFNVHHSSVLHGVQNIDNLCTYDKAIKDLKNLFIEQATQQELNRFYSTKDRYD